MKQNWLQEIQSLDAKAKFIRETDEMINKHQEDGRLQVLMVYSRGDNRGKYYYCQCDCGKMTTVWGSHFRTGHSKSCGCWHDESSKIQINKLVQSGQNYKGHDISNQEINGFQVLEKIGKNNNSEWVYRCICPHCLQECYKTEKGVRNTLSCGCIKISHGEQKIADLLNKSAIKFHKEKTFEGCVYEKKLRFDFYVDDKYLIEFDGEQHFKENYFFSKTQNLEETQKRDSVKNQWCKEHNIPLIRIPYTHLKDLCLEDLLLETSQYVVKE